MSLKGFGEIKDKNQIYKKIERQKQNLDRAQEKIAEMDNRIQKIVESNIRNKARLQRHRARLHQLFKAKEHPQILVAFSGIMNEYVQTFMLTHNFQMNVDITAMNPDNMSYEQLIELGQKIGKVSKGLTKEQIETLDHIKIKKKDESCPICCTQFQPGELAINLRCKHSYHEECIVQWFKDQNRCPICKQYALKDMEEKNQ